MVLKLFSVACLGVKVALMFHLMFVHCTFSKILVAEWSPFVKLLPVRLTICSHCLLSICFSIYFLSLRPGFGF